MDKLSNENIIALFEATDKLRNNIGSKYTDFDIRFYIGAMDTKCAVIQLDSHILGDYIPVYRVELGEYELTPNGIYNESVEEIRSVVKEMNKLLSSI